MKQSPPSMPVRGILSSTTSTTLPLAAALFLLCFTASAATKTQSPRGATVFPTKTFAVKAVAAPVPIVPMLTWTGSIPATVSRCSTKIARRSDGLHALPFCDVTQWPPLPQIAWWTNSEIPTISTLAITNFMASSEAYAEWQGANRLIVVDNTGVSMRTTELSYPLLETTKQWTWGDTNSRWGMSWPTKEGGVAFCVWAEPEKSVNNQLWIDLAYRNPTDLPIPGMTNTWYQRFKLAGLVAQLNAPVPHNLAFCQGSDGLLYAFCTRDSAGVISMTRWQMGPGSSWTLVDHNPGVIRSGPAAVNGEYPTVTAIPDKYNNRIILGYQTWEYRDNPSCPERLQSYIVLTAIYPDKRVEVIGKGDWWSSHDWYPRIVPWSRRDGIYVMTQRIKDDCDFPLLPAFFNYASSNKVLYPSVDLPDYYEVQALCDDGWIGARNNNGKLNLVKVRFRPELKIKGVGSNVQVSWDDSMPNDQLYISTDQKNFTAGQVGPSPVTVTKDVKSKWFKVKQSP